jgi:hypothetical protein
MQPMPTVVTFKPVFPRVLYCNAGPEEDRAGVGDCGCPEPEERVAEATAGKTKPAVRKLRRDEMLLMDASTDKTMLTSQFYTGCKDLDNAFFAPGVARFNVGGGRDVVYTNTQEES